jgi:hypothetical protein
LFGLAVYGAWSNADAIEDYMRGHLNTAPDPQNMDSDELLEHLQNRTEFWDAARDAYQLGDDVGGLTPGIDLPGPDDILDPTVPLIEKFRDWCMSQVM